MKSKLQTLLAAWGANPAPRYIAHVLNRRPPPPNLATSNQPILWDRRNSIHTLYYYLYTSKYMDLEKSDSSQKPVYLN